MRDGRDKVCSTHYTRVDIGGKITSEKISSKAFDERFKGVKGVTTNETKSADPSINTIEVADCITIFGRYSLYWGAQVACGHFSNPTTKDEVLEFFDDFGFDKEACDLILIGGDALTARQEEGSLLLNIQDAIKEYFPNGLTHVKVELLNVVPDDQTYLDANLNINGTLTYCTY